MAKNNPLAHILTDPPIAYRPIFAHITKSVKAALLLSQLLYWHGKGKYGDWTFKTANELYKETGLTRNEQETARLILKSLGIIEDKLKGVPATLHFRVDIDRLGMVVASFLENSKLDWQKMPNKISEKSETGLAKSAKQDLGNLPNKISEIAEPIPKNTSENTSENTQKNTSNNNDDDVYENALNILYENWGCNQPALKKLNKPELVKAWAEVEEIPEKIHNPAAWIYEQIKAGQLPPKPEKPEPPPISDFPPIPPEKLNISDIDPLQATWQEAKELLSGSLTKQRYQYLNNSVLLACGEKIVIQLKNRLTEREENYLKEQVSQTMAGMEYSGEIEFVTKDSK